MMDGDGDQVTPPPPRATAVPAPPTVVSTNGLFFGDVSRGCVVTLFFARNTVVKGNEDLLKTKPWSMVLELDRSIRV